MRLRHFASILITAATCTFSATQLSAVDYYLNSQTGNDINTGTQPNHAWASLQKASDHAYQPGDQLLIAAGTQYTGQLTLTSSGIAGNTITSDQPINIGPWQSQPQGATK
jgi:hypothetical protein